MKKLLKYMKGYGKECVLGPLFKLLEASFELLIPLVVASIVDTGIVGGDNGYATAVSVTGNLIYRSGKPGASPFDDVYDSAHVRMTRGDNIVLTGNTFRIGCDDGGVGIWSPNYCVVIKDCNQCIVRDNVWNRGAIEEGFILLGDNSDVITEGNMGCAHNPEN